jgi:drug/metabolite transporter (DMT)-like permease
MALLGVTVWGFIFWDAPVETIGIVGIVLTAFSIFLCLYEGKSEEKKRFSWKWLFWALMTFLGSAGCTIVQRTQQMVFRGKYGSGFMMYALLFSALVNLVFWLQSDRSDAKRALKKFGGFPIVAGVSNFAQNIFVILLATTTLSPGIIYPVIGVGVLMLTTLFTVFVLKERLKWWQWIGIMVGMAAILLLSL